jgi:hypothetical protein
MIRSSVKRSGRTRIEAPPRVFVSRVIRSRVVLSVACAIERWSWRKMARVILPTRAVTGAKVAISRRGATWVWRARWSRVCVSFGHDEDLRSAIRRRLAGGGPDAAGTPRRTRRAAPAKTLKVLNDERRKLLDLYYAQKISATAFNKKRRVSRLPLSLFVSRWP